jgi:hypothetical protein
MADVSARDKDKDLNRRARRDRRVFSSLRLSRKSFYAYFGISASSRFSAVFRYSLIFGEENLSFSLFSADKGHDEERKAREEEAESAEIIP